MTHNPADDFDGPWYPPEHPNRPFVLYRLTEADWWKRTYGPEPGADRQRR
jgi:hypothetical protein